MSAKNMRPLSGRAITILRRIAHGIDPFFDVVGMSQHGGTAGIMSALSRRGFIDRNDEVTAAGRDFVYQWERRNGDGLRQTASGRVGTDRR